MNVGADRGLGAERRLATVLFCDLVGSTSIGHELDPEVLRALLDRYFASVRGDVERHGGTIEKFAGDAVLAVFGVPLAHDDDAERAVRCALAILDSLERISGPELEVRIGVNSGEVLVDPARRDESLVTGDAVNVAARLQQAAGPGQILVGAETARLTRRVLAYRELEPLALRGKPGFVPAFEPVGGVEAVASPFVGRESELDAALGALQSIHASRRPGLVVITGDPGIGKSRLVAEVTQRLDGVQVLRGRCRSYGDRGPFAAIVEAFSGLTPELVDALLDRGPEAERASVRAGLDALLAGSETSSGHVFFAVRRLVEELARKSPLLLVFEDVQWADQVLVDLVAHVLLLAERAPLAVVATARSGFTESLPSATATIELAGLDERSAAELLQRVSDGRLDPGLYRTIAERAEGNPLFLLELAAMLGEDPKAARALPNTVRASILARLDVLPVRERAVLQVASVVGTTFWAGIVERLAGGLSAGVLDRLRRRGILLEVRSAIPAEREFSFHHVLVRDTAYESVPKVRRASLHAEVLQWLEERLPESGEASPDLAGYHAEAAWLLQRELEGLTSLDPSIAGKAAQYLAAAGDRRRQVGALSDALDRYERALTLLADVDDAELEAEVRAGTLHCLLQIGLLDGARVQAEAARTAARDAGRLDLEAIARANEAWTLLRLGLPFRDAAEEALRLAQESGEPRPLFDANRFLGEVAWDDGRLSDAIAFREEIVRHAEAFDPLLAAGERAWLAAARHAAGDVDAAERLAVEALEIADRIGSPYGRAIALRTLARIAQVRGDHDTALQHARESARLLHELAMFVYEVGLGYIIGELLNQSGRLDEAEDVLRQTVERSEAVGEVGYRSEALAWLSLTLTAEGKADEAEQTARRGLDLVAADDAWTQANLRRALARALAAQERFEEAIAAADEAVERRNRGEWVSTGLPLVLDMADTYLAAGEHERARQAVQLAAELAERLGPNFEEQRLRRLEAELVAA